MHLQTIAAVCLAGAALGLFGPVCPAEAQMVPAEDADTSALDVDSSSDVDEVHTWPSPDEQEGQEIAWVIRYEAPADVRRGLQATWQPIGQADRGLFPGDAVRAGDEGSFTVYFLAGGPPVVQAGEGRFSVPEQPSEKEWSVIQVLWKALFDKEVQSRPGYSDLQVPSWRRIRDRDAPSLPAVAQSRTRLIGRVAGFLSEQAGWGSSMQAMITRPVGERLLETRPTITWDLLAKDSLGQDSTVYELVLRRCLFCGLPDRETELRHSERQLPGVGPVLWAHRSSPRSRRLPYPDDQPALERGSAYCVDLRHQTEEDVVDRACFEVASDSLANRIRQAREHLTSTLPRGDSTSITREIAEAALYLQHGLSDSARPVLRRAQARQPGHPTVETLWMEATTGLRKGRWPAVWTPAPDDR
jgi:hypothetical protein